MNKTEGRPCPPKTVLVLPTQAYLSPTDFFCVFYCYCTINFSIYMIWLSLMSNSILYYMLWEQLLNLPPVCCKFLEVRESKLIIQPTISVNRLFSKKMSPSTHSHIHVIKHMHTTRAELCKEQGLFIPFYKAVIRLRQDHIDIVILFLKAHIYKKHISRRCQTAPKQSSNSCN